MIMCTDLITAGRDHTCHYAVKADRRAGYTPILHTDLGPRQTNEIVCIPLNCI